jgi:hypothetical protein
MSNPNILPSNRAVLAAVIDPDQTSPGTATTGWVSMATYESLQAIVGVGDMETGGTVDAVLQQATDASGTGAKDISGKAITQLTKAGSKNDHQAIINLRSEELDVANAFTHVRLSVTVGDAVNSPASAKSDIFAVILGHNARYAPASDATTVSEVVS